MNTVYAVTFKAIAPKFDDKERLKLVTLTDGYSDFEDIRKILGIPLGLKPEQIKIMALTIVEE